MEAGARPLLVCFNRLLSELLSAALQGGYVSTFNGFCAEFLAAMGEHLDFSVMAGNPDFWPAVQDRVMGMEIPDDWLFDSLVVDEGQDFETEWWDILRLFLKSDGPVMWLEDQEQNLRGNQEIILPGFVTWRSRRNYRSPESIARFAQEVLPFDIDPMNELPGLGVGVHAYEEPDEQPDVVRKIVLDLMRRGFAQEQIVLVSMRGIHSSGFSALERIGTVPLRRFTGEYYGPRQVMTPGRLRFETINRFKGQEAPAVILVDVDPSGEGERLARAEKLLWCGITRATVRLDVVARADNPYTLRMLEAAG